MILLASINCDLNVCGDWIQYKDNKCFKVLEKKSTEDEAIAYCKQSDQKSSLVSIHSKEEQEFLNNVLKIYSNISDNAWIGLKYNNKSYEWLDGSDTNYTNWSDDAVRTGDEPCVLMSIKGEALGKWLDESCKRQAIGVCQKKPEITLDLLKNILEYQNDVIDKMNKHITKLESEIKDNVIPLNFIYTQLPWQKSPQELWPQWKWQEVTSKYAGVFFRAQGGNSAAFEIKQDGNAPRLVSVRTLHNSYDVSYNINTTLNTGEESRRIITGRDGGSYSTGLSFHISGGEVRPNNMAIKLWTRIN